MPSIILFLRSSCLLPVLALAATGVSATTIEPVALDDIARVDELGFACISEDDLETAFAATGKKDGAVPRTCMPRPCDRQIDGARLAEILGRDPTEEQWSDYVARYADLCVAETGAPWPEDVMFANASDEMKDFWANIAGEPLNSGVGSDIVTDIGTAPGSRAEAIRSSPTATIAGNGGGNRIMETRRAGGGMFGNTGFGGRGNKIRSSDGGGNIFLGGNRAPIGIGGDGGGGDFLGGDRSPIIIGGGDDTETPGGGGGNPSLPSPVPVPAPFGMMLGAMGIAWISRTLGGWRHRRS